MMLLMVHLSDGVQQPQAAALIQIFLPGTWGWFNNPFSWTVKAGDYAAGQSLFPLISLSSSPLARSAPRCQRSACAQRGGSPSGDDIKGENKIMHVCVYVEWKNHVMLDSPNSRVRACCCLCSFGGFCASLLVQQNFFIWILCRIFP